MPCVHDCAFTFYYDININAVGNKKRMRGLIPIYAFKLVYYNFPMLIMRGVCEFDDGSHGHSLQYTYMYMTKTGQKKFDDSNKLVLFNNSV